MARWTAAVLALALAVTLATWAVQPREAVTYATNGRSSGDIDEGTQPRSPSNGRSRPPTPPAQPAAGPGGRDYPHAGVTRGTGGAGAGQYWIFEPADPMPHHAPVVVFLHGWGAMLPDLYLEWIHHIVRKGRIVIYPRYQASLATSPAVMTDQAVSAVGEALKQLQTGHHVRPKLDEVAFVGHSLGGVIAANMAARASSSGGLPVPGALMVVQPADPPLTDRAVAFGQPSIMEDYGRIARQTLMLVVVGEEDRTVGERTARIIFRRAGVAPPNKNYVVLRSDRRGRPPLVADHYAPTALPPPTDPEVPPVAPPWFWALALRLYGLVTGQPDVERRVQEADALDFYGLWKLFDALTDAAFYFRHREVALGDTPQQRYMGVWSDGVPVRELDVLTAEEIGDREDL